MTTLAWSADELEIYLEFQTCREKFNLGVWAFLYGQIKILTVDNTVDPVSCGQHKIDRQQHNST